MKAKDLYLAMLLALVSPVTSGAEPEIAGIGAALAGGDLAAGPRIVKVLPNSPAAQANLLEGLIITKINNTLTAGKKLEECVALVRGLAGTFVRLETIDPKDGNTSEVTLIREKLGLLKP